MRLKTKFLAGLTAVCMLCSCVPLTGITHFGIVASAEKTISEDIVLEEDMTVNGDMELNASLDLNGHTLTVDGNFTQYGDVYADNAESSLVVNGSYMQPSGVLDIGAGKVTAEKYYLSSSRSIDDRFESTGEIKFGEGGLLDVSGVVYICSEVESSDYQTEGTLRVGGNLYVDSPANGRGYMPSGNHVTEFVGNSSHSIEFSNLKNNNLNIVKFEEKPNSYIYLKSMTGFIMGSDIKLYDDSILHSGRDLDLNGHTLTVDGTFTQYGNINVDNAESSLVVNGSYMQPSGVLNIGVGKVTAEKYYLSSNRSVDDRFESTGEIKFGKGGLLDVSGVVYICSEVESSDYQKEGTLRVGGDLYVDSPAKGRGYMPSENHITEFVGNSSHVIEFGNFKNNNLNIVKFEEKPNSYIYLKNMTGFIMGSDIKLYDDSILYSGRELELNGHTLTVDGEFTQYGNINVDNAESSLVVNGTYMQPSGVLNIGAGKVTAENYYLSSNKSVDDRFESTGEIKFGKGGLLDVSEVVYICSEVESSDYQTEGTLRVGGNLYVDSPAKGRGYMPSENHVTEFVGNNGHIVNFGEYKNNYLNKLKLEKRNNSSLTFSGSTGGFIMESNVNLKGDNSIYGSRALDLNGYKLTVEGDFHQEGSADINVKALKNADENNGSSDPAEVPETEDDDKNDDEEYDEEIETEELRADEPSDSEPEISFEVSGDYYQSGGKLNVDGNIVNVEGNYNQSGGVLDPGSGSVYIGGYYSVTGNGELHMETKGGHVKTAGNVIIDSSVEKSVQSEGILEIGGNLTVESPENGLGYTPSKNHVTKFYGKKAHQVYFENEKSYMNIIHIGVEDTLTFEEALNGILNDGSGEIISGYDKIAAVNDLNVEGVSDGATMLTFKNSEKSTENVIIVGDGDISNITTTQPVKEIVVELNYDPENDSSQWYHSDNTTFTTAGISVSYDGKDVTDEVSIEFEKTPSEVYDGNNTDYEINFSVTYMDIRYEGKMPVKIGLRADSDMNGAVSLYDAIYVAKYLISHSEDLIEDGSFRKFTADNNEDGRVDLYDAINIAKYMISSDWAKVNDSWNEWIKD